MNTEIILAILVFFPFLGGLLSYPIGKHAELSSAKQNKHQNAFGETVRDIIVHATVLLEFALMVFLLYQYAACADTSLFAQYHLADVCGFGLTFALDGFRLLYGTVASFMWLMTTALSKEYFTHHENRSRFYLFQLLTLGATMGVFLSADLYTTFIFFEIMSFTSYVWVAQEETSSALRAAETYLAVAIIGGLVMLMGIFLLYHELGTLNIRELFAAASQCQNKTILYIAGGCMLFGFGAKAGAFPLHIWLPKAHPVAPAPASALLSGILTKTGIYGILIISCNLFLHDALWGNLILVIGTITMLLGAVLAVFSIDLKRTLACSSMSQIGFILIGIGMQGLLGEENILAVHGTLLHMMNHSMIKLVLFMAAGVIFMNTHALELNKIRGFGRKKPLLHIIFLIGAITIAGIPGLGGYISKTLLHESIVEYGAGWFIRTVEYIFLFSGGLTLAYMTKLYAAIFIEKNEEEALQQKYDDNRHYMNPESTIALAGSALVLLIWGLFPHAIMDKAAVFGQKFMLAEEIGENVSYFSLKNLSGSLISIAIGVLVYFLFIRAFLMKTNEKGNKEYCNLWPEWLDLENLIYRPLLLTILPNLFGFFCRILDSLIDWIVVSLRKSLYRDSKLPQELPEGTRITKAIGVLLNAVQKTGNLTWKKTHPTNKNYIHIMALKHDGLKETNTIIGRSLSFGLLLFVSGLLITLIYLIAIH